MLSNFSIERLMTELHCGLINEIIASLNVHWKLNLSLALGLTLPRENLGLQKNNI